MKRFLLILPALAATAFAGENFHTHTSRSAVFAVSTVSEPHTARSAPFSVNTLPTMPLHTAHSAFFTVDTRRTRCTPEPVLFWWLNDYMDYFGETNYEKLAKKRGENGYYLWESYVAGLDPTDAESIFLCSAFSVDAAGNIPYDCSPPILRGRFYSLVGKTNLTDETWLPYNEGLRFFRVKVSLTPPENP